MPSDPMAGIRLVQAVVAPSGPAARRYGAPVSHRLSAIETAITDALSGSTMAHSPALSKMTREVARTAPDRTNIPTGLVDGLMAWAGLVDPPPRMVVVEIPGDLGCARQAGAACESPVALLAEQAEATAPAGDAVIFGVGVAGLANGSTRMVVSILDRAVDLEPLASAVGAGGTVQLRGRLLGGRASARVEVVSPGGDWVEATVADRGGRFSAAVSCSEERGAHQVEIMAEGRHGPEVAANFPLYCGAAIPTQMTIEVEQLDPGISAEQIAWANFTYVNEERARRGLPALVWDDKAAAIATAHSRDMERNGFVGHRSPATGDVRARFERARLQGAVIRENVARGYGPKGIHDSLMRSPGHRVNMLAPDVTHLGVGVVVAPPETTAAAAARPIFCTQNYYRAPGAGAPEADSMAPSLRNQVDAVRERRGLEPLAWDPALSQLAERLAKTYVRGRTPRPGFEKSLWKQGFTSIATHQVESSEFDALAGVELWLGAAVPVGVAIERSREGFLMVVVVGER